MAIVGAGLRCKRGLNAQLSKAIVVFLLRTTVTIVDITNFTLVTSKFQLFHVIFAILGTICSFLCFENNMYEASICFVPTQYIHYSFTWRCELIFIFELDLQISLAQFIQMQWCYRHHMCGIPCQHGLKYLAYNHQWCIWYCTPYRFPKAHGYYL